MIDNNTPGPSTPLIPSHADAHCPETTSDKQSIEVVPSLPVDSMPSSENPEVVAEEEDPSIVHSLPSNTTPIEAVDTSPMERLSVSKDPLKVKPPVFEIKTAQF